ncbi:MAG: lysophospholipid acyltransferase family protein [Deltaproteobacteria bacterium]|nr:lysophospholipid acyltransferase family protein [Deltaproteobacteria bacterium]
MTRGINWSSRSLGSRLQHDIFYFFIRLGGRWVAYGLLFCVVLCYMFKPEAARRSAPYLTRRFPDAKGFEKFLHRWRLQWEFGKVLVDRAVAGITGEYSVITDEAEIRAIRDLCSEGRGLILLSSHTGNWHISMSVLPALPDVPVGVVLYRDAADLDRHYFDHSGEKTSFTVIDPSTGPYSSIAMVQILQRGGMLCLMGDRSFGDKRLCRVPFLGDTAELPYTAYYLASVTGAPVVQFFSFWAGMGKARAVIAKVIRVPEKLGKNPEAYTPFVREYVEALELSITERPYQFFNFYNMWSSHGCQGKVESRVD